MWEVIMRYMVRDKSLYSFVIFVFAAIIYITYLFYDFKNQGNGWREDFGLHKKSEILKVPPNALLLGGSNVAYSLSANQLTTLTEYSWYNLGLSSEAFNDQNYLSYVSTSLNDEQRLNVDLVVYSGIAPLKSGFLAGRRKDRSDPWGKRNLSLLPNDPLALTLKNVLLRKDKKLLGYPLPIMRGDFNFNKKRCDQNYKAAFEREMNWKEVEAWVIFQVSKISETFPNAELVFVTPSVFYGETYDLNLDNLYTTKLASLIQYKFNSKVKFLAQPPYFEKNITCDNEFHGNEEGRAWRTNNLTIFLSSLN